MNDNARFAILAILDGWGLAASGPGNAITQANIPNMRGYWVSFPHTQLGASGQSVGLPRGEVGNTETGHLNIGAGRIVYQDLARINMAIADGSFFENQTLLEAIDHARRNNTSIHIMGLVGAGGVHSNAEHLYALLTLMHKHNVQNVFIHVFTDGRDSPPNAAKTYVTELQKVCAREGVGKIVSIMGRYWAMDRDHRWERTLAAYNALVVGEAKQAASAEAAIDASYAQGKTDEFIEPTLIVEPGQTPHTINDNDSVVFFNFRIDRPRQLSREFLMQDGNALAANWGFDPYSVKYVGKHTDEAPAVVLPERRKKILKNLYFATMTEYEKPLVEAGAHVCFPPEKIAMPMGRVVSSHGYRQLRAAESEKERFVTFYMNGQEEGIFAGEERLIVPSPKVATYDLAPQMSAKELTDAVIAKITPGGYSLVIMNFANADMVGHTGNLAACIKAVETVDACVGRLGNFVLSHGGALFITADHGNAEEKIDLHTGQVSTEHSGNPVPFIVVSQPFIGKGTMLPSGILADVAPTVLHYLSIETPSSMMGKNLLSGF